MAAETSSGTRVAMTTSSPGEVDGESRVVMVKECKAVARDMGSTMDMGPHHLLVLLAVKGRRFSHPEPQQRRSPTLKRPTQCWLSSKMASTRSAGRWCLNALQTLSGR